MFAVSRRSHLFSIPADAIDGPGLSRCGLAWIAIAAMALRIAVVGCVLTHYQVSVGDYARKGDGESYIRYAKAMLGNASEMTEYDQRVFPGYPLMIAGLHLAAVPFPLAALGIDWVAAALAAAMAAVLFRDRRVGWAMVMLIPHYLMNSSMAMTEAPLLALTLAGLLLIRGRWFVMAGVIFAIAALVRPMACFAVLGGIAYCVVMGWTRKGILCAVISAIVLGAGVGLMHLWTGDALRGVRIYHDAPGAYAGHMIVWPFESLIMTPIRERVPGWKIPYIWIHVAIVIGACVACLWGLVRRKVVGERLGLMAVAAPWLVGNTLFVLCIRSGWGFNHFPRFCIPAQPALFFVLRPVLPRHWGWWGLFALASFLTAVLTVMRG